MSVATYKKGPGKKPPNKGRTQHRRSPKGTMHEDFRTIYGRPEHPVDLQRQHFRLLARSAGKEIDVTDLMVTATWQDQSADTLALVNAQPILTGSLAMQKPSLEQYKHLILPMFQATADARDGTSRFGAMGVVFVCQVGYGGHYTPVWAMRAATTDNGAAEQVELQDGTWTINLADDLQLLNESNDDFKFAKGVTARKRGWRADEVAVAVCRQYSVPVKSLVKGTAYHSFSLKDTSNVSPLMMIANAYQEETNKTGKTFIVRWSVPTREFPFGALEVVPMRRNPNLLRFRDQLTDATLTRAASPDFATAITGRASLKQAGGKTRPLSFTFHNAAAIRRFGFIHKIIDFKPVSSELELHLLVKRALAFRLTPIRTAELVNPGVATIRRGDAVRIDIPEEGYGPVAVDAFGQPRTSGLSKSSVAALRAAEQADPSLFGLPDPSLFSPTASSSPSLQQKALTSDTPVAVPVADQSIAFVTSVSHTASSGSYTVDLQTSFVDILDPKSVKESIEANIRAAKAAARASSGSKGGGGGGSGWRTVIATEYTDSTGACFPSSNNGGMTYAELNGGSSSAPGPTQLQNPGLGPMFGYPHGLPCGFKLEFRNPTTGQTAVGVKADWGAGAPGAQVDLHNPGLMQAIGFTDGKGPVQIRAA